MHIEKTVQYGGTDPNAYGMGGVPIHAVKDYEPYDKIVKPLPDMRRATVTLVRHANAGNLRAYVLVNNPTPQNPSDPVCDAASVSCVGHKAWSVPLPSASRLSAVFISVKPRLVSRSRLRRNSGTRMPLNRSLW